MEEPEYGTVDLGYLVVHAAGSVTARTWRTLEETIPLTYQAKVYTGEEQTGYGIKILWNDLDFFENSSISQGRYDKITRTEQLTPFGRALPVWLTTTTLRPYTLEEKPIDQEEAAARLEGVLLACTPEAPSRRERAQKSKQMFHVKHPYKGESNDRTEHQH